MEKFVEIPLDLAQKCVKCGLCKSVCPTYRQEEGSYARGRLALAEMVVKGDLPLTEEVAKQWDECAMCRRCEWICPNDVQYKEIMAFARHHQKEKLGMGLVKRMALKSLMLLQSPLGRKVVPILGKILRLLPAEGLRIIFPTGARKFMPKASPSAFELRGKVFQADQEKGKLLFFTGCMIDAFYTETGRNVIKLMNKAGYTVIVPEDIRCCGAPHYYSGDMESFTQLKEHNMKEMSKYQYDAVVVACPTCGGALKEDYGIDKDVFDFTQIIQKNPLPFKGNGERVTFHVPCHSYTAMKLKEEVFYDTLKMVKNAEVRKASKDKSCCGFAGIFSITNPALSDKIQKEKMDDLLKTEAQVVLTTCPGCVLQLTDGTRKYGKCQKVMHLADYLAQRLHDGEDRGSLQR